MQWAGSRVGRVAATAVLMLAAMAPSAIAQDDQQAMLARLKELIEARGGDKFVIRAEGSRSTVLAVDVSTSLFFFIERGSIRGSAIDEFDAAMASGDMEAAHRAFMGSAIMTLRATDYGWNGLGNSLTTTSGAEVNDIVFKDVGGVFGRAPEISEEDIAGFVALVQYIIAELERS